MKTFLVLGSLILALNLHARSELNLEAGVVRNSYNRVAIPGDDGTAFDLSNSVDESYFYHRLSYSHKFDSPHGFRLLYAPLRITGSETYSKDIDFSGVTFNGGSKVNTEYQFNSYRASYFYQMVDRENWIVRIGPTLKIRDAKVKLVQGNKSKFKKNTGIVPLLYLFSEYKLSPKFRVAFDFDGWAAPQGRAFDAGLMAGYYFRDNMHLNLGYRILEGGADNDTAYNFAQLNYWLTALQINF